MELVAVTGSLRLDVRKLHHLAPLLSFVGDELAEVRGRARERRNAQVSRSRLRPRIGEGGVYLFVEFVDDLGGRVPGCAEAVNIAGFIAPHEIPHGPQVRKPAPTSSPRPHP